MLPLRKANINTNKKSREQPITKGMNQAGRLDFLLPFPLTEPAETALSSPAVLFFFFPFFGFGVVAADVDCDCWKPLAGNEFSRSMAGVVLFVLDEGLPIGLSVDCRASFKLGWSFALLEAVAARVAGVGAFESS